MEDCVVAHTWKVVQQHLVVRQWLALCVHHAQHNQARTPHGSLARELYRDQTEQNSTRWGWSDAVVRAVAATTEVTPTPRGEEREQGLPAGPAAAAPSARARSGCQTHGSASGSAAAPSPPPLANPPAALPSATRWPACPGPAAGHYTAWLPAPGFSNATQITHRQADVWIQQANDPPTARGEG